jgi:hypothetical protein
MIARQMNNRRLMTKNSMSSGGAIVPEIMLAATATYNGTISASTSNTIWRTTGLGAQTSQEGAPSCKSYLIH